MRWGATRLPAHSLSDCHRSHTLGAPLKTMASLPTACGAGIRPRWWNGHNHWLPIGAVCRRCRLAHAKPQSGCHCATSSPYSTIFFYPRPTMDTKNNPKVTVLLPVYNGAPTLREAVLSILKQSFTDFELL